MVGVAPRGLGAIGAVVARFVHTEEVTGSNPVSPTSITPGEVQFEGEDPVGVQDTCRIGPGDFGAAAACEFAQRGRPQRVPERSTMSRQSRSVGSSARLLMEISAARSASRPQARAGGTHAPWWGFG